MACNRFCISEWYSFDLPSYARLKRPSCGSYCLGYVIRVVPLLVCSQPHKQKAPYVTGYRYTPKAALDRVRVSQFFWYVQYSLVRRLEAFQARQILSCRINCSACTFRNLFKNTESSPIYSLCIINSFWREGDYTPCADDCQVLCEKYFIQKVKLISHGGKGKISFETQVGPGFRPTNALAAAAATAVVASRRRCSLLKLWLINKAFQPW